MKAIWTTVFSVMATAAWAHPSTVSHAHPHDVGVLPGLDTLGIAALVVVGLLALRKLLRS